MKRKVNALSFTPKYDELEDRIRISINYDDFENRVDFMMTRSFILKLFPVFDDFLFKFYDSDTISLDASLAPVEKVKKMIKEDKATSVTDGSNLELYKQEDELLVEVKLSYIKDTKMSLIQFESKISEATAQLDQNSLQQIFTVIKSTIPFFSWGISQNL